MYRLTLIHAKRVRDPRIKKEDLNYLSLLKVAVFQQPQGGFSLEESRKRNKLMDQLEELDSEFAVKGEVTFELEDEHFKKLKECYDNCRFGMIEPVVDEIGDYLKGLQPIQGKKKD